ncbi:MAG TPA: three-Cys-motif partner protein TcmP [Terriglobales bacterium]|nr:three-Cys-motif partner protein TcmP [Terriglobales bacterium]
MDELEAIGIWSEIKLQIIREYAAAYTTILKEQSWCRGYAYIDAFAGGGQFVSKNDRERLIVGSPLNALNIQNKFTEYHFIDIDPLKINRLRELTVDHPERSTIHFYTGDANKIVIQEILQKFQYNSFKRALCILDPYGVDIEWATIAKIGQTKTMDVYLNFPLMDINRNAARKFIELSDPKQGEKLTKIWGDDSWKELAYTIQDRLFGEPILIKIKGNETLKQGFMDRLKNKAGFSYVPEPVLMRNQQGGPLYFLFFASHKPVAQDIAEDIFQKWDVL